MDTNGEIYQSNDLSSDPVSLLITLLIRYPQLSTIHYEPDEHVVRLGFLLKDVTKKQLSDFLESFAIHLEAFHAYLSQPKYVPSVAKIQHDESGELCMLEILRDMPSLSREELNLIIQLTTEFFGGSLVVDNVASNEEEHIDHDAMIASILAAEPEQFAEKLTGFREKGKVLVFSTPPNNF